MRAASLLLLILGGCAVPPASAYLGGSERATATVGIGTDAAGEACTQGEAGDRVDVYCGAWNRPSGHIAAMPAGSLSLQAVATASAWRTALDTRLACGDPAPVTIAGNVPALLLACTRRVGGWPEAAVVARIGERDYLADAILPALPAVERGIAILSGRSSPATAAALPSGDAAGLAASRLAARSFSAGDVGQYEALMAAGARANLAENFTGAEAAYRAAYALQEKALGAGNPNTAVPLALIALQLSNQGRQVEAAAGFDRADRLVGTLADPLAVARLKHYRGLAAVNEGRSSDAVALLQQAEQGYARLLPPELLTTPPARRAAPAVATRGHAIDTAAAEAALIPPAQQAALIGVVETRRNEAIALRELGRTAEARDLLASAAMLTASRGLRQQDLTARISRTAALIDDSAKAGSGVSGMDRASQDFDAAQPGTRPVAQTLLLRAAQSARAGDSVAALPLCRRATALLTELKAGTAPELIAPCLDAFADSADRQPQERQALLGEMFATAQLAQGSITARQIALASARLTEGAHDPRVGTAIRRQQDASLAVADLQSRLDLATAAEAAGRAQREMPAALAGQLAAARAALGEAETGLQAVAPNYGQLVQEVVSAGQVLRAVGPDEAFVSFALTRSSGWVFVLRGGQIAVSRARIGSQDAAAMVGRIRATVELGDSGEPKPFDVADAQALYAGLLAPAASSLEGAQALTVVPTGALLSLPFEVLLTGPADPARLAAAPWLMQRFAITHVPAPANFVSLRRLATGGGGSQPWFGFGDFRPVTLRQASATFPSAACQDSAKLFAGLPPLPFAARELAAARQIMGASPGAELLGAAFNSPAVLRTDLRGIRVLHFATHALLPTDLSCQTEPAVVTSDLPGAANANSALLTASAVTAMQLDAEVVILSACNSGGPAGGAGATAGESLSGLARAFFYAGARAMMVTHWSVNDQATALLIAGTLARLRAGDPLGLAGAFQHTQQSMLADAGTRLPAAIAHPFYWAPFALVGEGGAGRRAVGL